MIDSICDVVRKKNGQCVTNNGNKYECLSNMDKKKEIGVDSVERPLSRGRTGTHMYLYSSHTSGKNIATRDTP